MSTWGANRDVSYFKQTNNAVEAIDRGLKAEIVAKLREKGVSEEILKYAKVLGYLESCGGDSIATGCAAVGGPEVVAPLVCRGGWKPQMDDIVMLCLNDPRNAAAVKAIMGQAFDVAGALENRYMTLHPLAARLVFGMEAEYRRNATYDDALKLLNEQNAVGMLIPGHYVCAVDERAGVAIGNDSWPERKLEWGGDGFNRDIVRSEFEAGPHSIVVYPRQEAWIHSPSRANRLGR